MDELLAFSAELRHCGFMSLWTNFQTDPFEDVPAAELSQVTAPLRQTDQARLTEFWSRVIAEAGADLPSRREAPTRPARRARRVQRQRSVRLVRVLRSAHRDAGESSGVVA